MLLWAQSVRLSLLVMVWREVIYRIPLILKNDLYIGKFQTKRQLMSVFIVLVIRADFYQMERLSTLDGWMNNLNKMAFVLRHKKLKAVYCNMIRYVKQLSNSKI